MSYCRFSTNDFQCDLYVYEDVNGGWSTWVAGNRLVFTGPLPPPVDVPRQDPDEYGAACIERYWKVSLLVVAARRVPIGLPYDNQHFNDPTPGACADRLEALKSWGYRVPQEAIDDLRAEHRNVQSAGEGGEL